MKKDWLDDALESAWTDLAAEGPACVEKLLRDISDRFRKGRRNREWVENLVDAGRAFGDLLLAGGPDKHVLNLGCGWDQTSIQLARTWGRVSAMDLTGDRIQVLALKKRLAGLDNIDLAIGGDTPRLPFADAAFDAVFLNGVLEWVASYWRDVTAAAERLPNKAAKLRAHLEAVNGERNPRRVQLRFLREIVRVLRPEGELFIGIENRHAREYFQGQPDNHSRLMFGSLMPRLGSHLASLIGRHKPYLTYTYSRRGYEKLLAEAGLPHSRFHALEPSYRQPRAAVDLDDGDACRGHIRRRGLLRGRMPVSLYRRTASCFGIVAGKTDTRVSRLQSILDRVAQQLALPGDVWRGASVTTSLKAKTTVAVRPGVEPVVVKIPLSPAAASGLLRNHEILSRLDQVLPVAGGLRDVLPRPLAHGEQNGVEFFVETMIAGRPWGSNSDLQPAWPIAETVLGLSAAIANALPETTIQAFAPAPPRMGAHEIRDLIASRDPGLVADFARIEEFVESNPASGPVLCKGDFSLNNIMLTADGSVGGLIDWDDSVLTRFPLQSLADFVFSWMWRKGKKRADTLAALMSLDSDMWSQEIGLSGALDRAGFERRDLAVAAISAWLDHARQEMRHLVEYFDSERIDSLLTEPCRRALPLLRNL